MSYVVDLGKHPNTLVRELFNHFNDTDYSEVELTIGAEPKSSPLEAYNTVVDVSLVGRPDIADIPHTTIHFNRIDLSTLFSVVEVKLREVDIKADGTFDEALILQEVQRKYGINTDSGLFGVKQVEGQDTFFAKVGNVAFVGHSPLVVELSLDSRVDLKELNGFEIYDGIPIDGVMVSYPIPAGKNLNDKGSYAAAAVGSVVYLHGGWSGVGRDNYANELWSYSVETNEWVQLASTTYGAWWHSMCTDGEFLYIATTHKMDRKLSKYDIARNVWTNLPDCPIATVNLTSAVAYYNGKVYSYCGARIAAFDIANEVWTIPITGLPNVGEGVFGKNIGSKWYLVYGNGMMVVDLDDGTYKTISGGETKVKYSAVAISGDDVYISKPDSVAFEKYNTVTGVWTRLPDLPKPRKSHDIVATQSSVIVLQDNALGNGDVLIYS